MDKAIKACTQSKASASYYNNRNSQRSYL